MAVSTISEIDHGPDVEVARLKLVRPAEPEPNAQPAHVTAAPAKLAYPTAQVMAVLEQAARALALRFLLFAGFGVASWLGYLVITDPTTPRIIAMCLWAVLIYIPIVSVNARQR